MVKRKAWLCKGLNRNDAYYSWHFTFWVLCKSSRSGCPRCQEGISVLLPTCPLESPWGKRLPASAHSRWLPLAPACSSPPPLTAAAAVFQPLNLQQLQFYELCRETRLLTAPARTVLPQSELPTWPVSALPCHDPLKKDDSPGPTSVTKCLAVISLSAADDGSFTEQVDDFGLAGDGFIMFGSFRSQFLLPASLILHFIARHLHPPRGKWPRHFCPAAANHFWQAQHGPVFPNYEN